MTKSAFHWNTGEQSMFMLDRSFNKNARMSHMASRAIEIQRATGRNNISFDPNPQQSADKTMRIKKGGI